MKWFSKVYQWLIEPHPELKDPLQRQRSAVLSLVLLIVPTFYLTTELLVTRFAGVYAYISDPHPWLALVSLLSLMLYGLNRTRYHLLTIWLTIFFAIGSILVMHISFAGGRGSTTLYYFATVIFAAGFICTTRQILALLALSYSSLLLLAIVPGLSTTTDLGSLIHIGLFMTIAGFITLGSRNVTRTLRREQRQAEQQIRGIFNAGGEAFLILNAETCEVKQSNQTAQMLFSGITHRLQGCIFADLLTEDSKKNFMAYRQSPDGTPHLISLSQPSGTPLYVEARLSPYPLGQDNALIVSLMDATEKIKTYEALATSERRFQEVFNSLVPFMALLDSDGKIIAANATAEAIVGLPASQMQNRVIWSFAGLAAASRDALQQLVSEALDGHQASGKIFFDNEEQETLIFECTIQPRQAGENEADVLILSARNVTDEVTLQESLYDIERRYDALFHRSENAIFIFDSSGFIFSVNEQAAIMMETTEEDIIGSDLIRFIAPEEYVESKKRMQALLNGEKVPAYRRMLVTAKGKYIVGEVSAMSVHDREGNVRYMQAIVRDVTQMEERERIKIQYKLMRARNDMMGEFITAASHHFRTPLTTIKASLYLLPRLQDRPEKYAEHMSVLNAEVERLQRLLNDLLLVVRLQRTTTSEYQLNITLSSLVKDLQARRMAKSSYDHHDWHWDLQESVETIQGSGEYIQRAMQNVLENAVAYTPEGGSITVRTFEQDQWAVFEVLDTGIGIADDDLHRIGQDFFRADAAQERQNANPGLGLSIVRQIMHRHQGTILLESVAGQGTRVQLLWPTNMDWAPLERQLPTIMLGDPPLFKNAPSKNVS